MLNEYLPTCPTRTMKMTTEFLINGRFIKLNKDLKHNLFQNCPTEKLVL